MKSKLLDVIAERVLLLDGAMGTSIHSTNLPLSDYNDLENCNEILTLTRPDVIQSIHESFLDAGSDAVLTNTFNGSGLVLTEFGLGEQTTELNREAAKIARHACQRFDSAEKPRFVIGSIGPGTKLPSLGHTTWDEMLASYLAQVRGLLDGGVDALLVETCQDILQAKCAIVACKDAMAERAASLPILTSFTVETTGTMLVGTEPFAAIVALEAFDEIRAIGLNCATGPEQMAEHIHLLRDCCDRTIIVQPNAGLPELVDGQPHYKLTPDEFARWMVEYVEVDGVGIVGGCCGTTPDHIEAAAKAIGIRKPGKREPKLESSCSSLYQAVSLRQDKAALAIGERTNANGSKKFRELLAAEDIDGMVQMARDQIKIGSHVLDVSTAYVGRDEMADMTNVVRRFVTDVTVPLMIDSTEPPVLEAALKLAGGRCIINSVNLEDGEGRLDEVCGLAKRYGAALVALTIDEEGMAKTAGRKVAIAKRIHDLAVNRHKLRPDALLFDALTFTLGTGNEDDRRLGMETLDAIKQIKEELPGVHAMLGVSNISFGLAPPVRKALNSVFLHYSLLAGMDCAIVHPSGIVPLYKIDEHSRKLAEDLVFDRRSEGYDPLQELLGALSDSSDKADDQPSLPKKVDERLKHRILDGNRVGLEDDLTEALTTFRPFEIVNDILLDGMKTVGDLFGAGQMQLPFVLASAETMKAAVKFLEPYMDRVEGQSKGSIVLATVRGDVHDIGKNLVDIILSNNGYTVHNLGIKQPISAIIEAVEEHKADAIGMSGLLVKSTVVMRENLMILSERSINTPVILGGAALTRRFVEEDLRTVYSEPLFYGKDAFSGLSIMDRIMAGEVSTTAAAPAPKPVKVTVPTPAKSAVSRDAPIPIPPFWGSRVLEDVSIRDVLPYLNEKMLFAVQWQYHKHAMSGGDYEKFIEQVVRPIFDELVDRGEKERILQPKVVYGYWPCIADGDVLTIFDHSDHSREVATFDFPRQRKAPYWCLADFFRPVEGGELDVVGFSLATAGHAISDLSRELFEADRYRDYLHTHGLGVEFAEALAEYVHRQMRVELGISGNDASEIKQWFQQKYQGSRYSFGYPACPRLEDQLKLWPLLDPERIGVAISEEFQLEPEQSTTAMICHHPEAKYFNAG